MIPKTEDGRILWQHPYDNFQLIIQDNALNAISGPWGNNVSRKFDPLTGKVLAELPTGRRACTRVVGMQDSILYRAMGGSIRFDMATDFPRWVSPMRPSPSHACIGREADSATATNQGARGGRLFCWFGC